MRAAVAHFVDSDEEGGEQVEVLNMKCISCKENYGPSDAGTCRECYEEASETEEELKREIEELKAKVNFLRFWAPHHQNPDDDSTLVTKSSSSTTNYDTTPWLRFSDVVLVASSEYTGDIKSEDGNPTTIHSVPVPAHRALLATRSPVFRAMLENKMEESLSGTIKISDVSYEALVAFVNYLYTGDTTLDESLACDLLILAEKYQVKHLKIYCERFLISKLNWDNSLVNYAFAHQHNAKQLLGAALSTIMGNMDKLDKREEYQELVEKDPRIVVEIYEAYLSKQVNTAAQNSKTNTF